MKQEYKEAFTEIYEIIKMMPDELVNKIPNKFREMIETERDTEYFPNITEPLENKKLKNETIIILGLIYRDFLCSADEKKRLQAKDAMELQEAQKILEELKQEYNPNDIFKNKNNDKEQQIEEKRMIVLEDETWYKKIFNLIKKLFKMNRE